MFRQKSFLLFQLLWSLEIYTTAALYCACQKEEGGLFGSNCSNGAVFCAITDGYCYAYLENSVTYTGCWSKEQAIASCSGHATHCCNGNFCNRARENIRCACQGTKSCGGKLLCSANRFWGTCSVSLSSTRNKVLRGCTDIFNCHNISSSSKVKACCRDPYCNGGHLLIDKIEGKFSFVSLGWEILFDGNMTFLNRTAQQQETQPPSNETKEISSTPRPTNQTKDITHPVNTTSNSSHNSQQSSLQTSQALVGIVIIFFSCFVLCL